MSVALTALRDSCVIPSCTVESEVVLQMLATMPVARMLWPTVTSSATAYRSHIIKYATTKHGHNKVRSCPTTTLAEALHSRGA